MSTAGTVAGGQARSVGTERDRHDPVGVLGDLIGELVVGYREHFPDCAWTSLRCGPRPSSSLEIFMISYCDGRADCGPIHSTVNTLTRARNSGSPVMSAAVSFTARAAANASA